MLVFLDTLLFVTVLVIVGLSGVRLVLLLLDGLRLVALLGGERLGKGEMDIGLSGELISALRFFVVFVVLLAEFCDVGAAGGQCGLPFWLLFRQMSSCVLSSLNSSLYCFFD